MTRKPRGHVRILKNRTWAIMKPAITIEVYAETSDCGMASSILSDYIGVIPITETQWGGGFQGTGMIEWGQNSKPKKLLRTSNKTSKNPPKNPMTNFEAMTISRQHQMIQLSRIFRLF